MTRTPFLTAILLLSLLSTSSRSTRADERDELFEAEIRPVLVGTCLRCHGDAKASGGLRVDSLEALLRGGESGPAIVPGNPADSLLLKAIQRQADVSAMPPEQDEALRADQVATFAKWVKAGAVWPTNTAKFEVAKHWSFEPLHDVEPPVVQDTAWVKSSIDLFIRAKQEAAGVRPAPFADKLTLIRRATFDLTGLPPTPKEVEAFEQDESPQAFERIVDRLLASPAYGERWGRHWLDVVRYADTAGETADYPVPLAWRYRNYVIDAFNNDKPYDEFLREQIAGDVLAEQGSHEHYAERATATGYLAISRRFGFDSENYHHLTIQDTIDTLGQSVLGLSLGCARCHDHKFDPISMQDYYGLYGIFDSSRYAFPGSEQKRQVRAMLPLLPTEESRHDWAAYEARVASLVETLAKQEQPVPTAILRSLHDMDGDFELQAPAAGGSNGVLVPPWQYSGTIAVTNAAQSPFKNMYPRGKVGASVPAAVGEYRIAQALRSCQTSDDCDALYVNIDFRIASLADNVSRTHRFWIGNMSASPAVEVLIGSEFVSLRVGQAIEAIGPVMPNEWHNLQLVLDLKSGTFSGKVGTQGRVTEFSDKPFSPGWSGEIDLVVLDSLGPTEAKLPAVEYDNLGVQDCPIAPVSTEVPPLAEGVRQELTSVPSSEELNRLLEDGPFAMAYGMAEGTPHNVRMHMRGEPDQLGIEVPRGFIKVLGGGPLGADTSGSGRLELAEWLTRPDNTLTARVMVNRIWQYHFGRGLVKTSNDFGVRGLPPTHRELLDHLATQFIENGWSVKSMHRLIMLSATYQESSAAISTLTPSTTVSGEYDLYVRFSRRRLSAEEIRDTILAVSGELDVTPAHEHPFPTPISWEFTQHSPFSAVYDHNNRSVYLMTQRLKRHPFLSLFDGADPNASTAERLDTTVPTQALFFLNDPFVHTKADKWAARLQANSGDETQAIEQSWQCAYGRMPTETERQEATKFLAAYRTELIAEKMDNVERRSLAAYLRTLIGSNEFLHVD